MRFDVFDDFFGFNSDVYQVPAMGMLHEVKRSADSNIAQSSHSIILQDHGGTTYTP